MTSEQITLVQNSWNVVKVREPDLADVFYARLFEMAPQVRPMFSDNMIGQKQKFRVMIGTVVKSLNRLDEVVAMVRALGKRHVGYGTQQGHYDVVAQALVGALAEMHGKTWSTDLQDAWVAAYTIVATTMKDAAAEVEPPLPTATAEATPKVVADAPAKAAVYQPPARGNFFARLKAFFRGQGSRT